MARLPVDLFSQRLTRPFLRPPWAQAGLRLLGLAGYVALAALGWGRDGIPGVPVLHPRAYTHATTLLFWVAWLMGLVLLVPLTGRAWCGVCPLGWVSDAVGRRGLGLPWPRWLARGWGGLAVFGAGVAAVGGAGVHLSPHGTAVLIVGVGALTLASGLLWRRGAFCRGLCPVGMALGLYTRHAPLEVRPRDPDRCAGCARRCIATDPEWRRADWGRWVWFRRRDRGGCPVALEPSRMDPTECTLCLRCLRRCPDGNLGLWWGRRPSPRALTPARAVFLGLLMGLVLLGVLRTWPEVEAALTPGVRPPAWFRGVWVGLAVPAVLLLAPTLAEAVWRRLAGRPAPRPAAGDPGRGGGIQPVWPGALRILPAFVGPVLGGHAALALVKINAKAAYLPYLLYDPLGTETYLAVHVSGLLPKPDMVVPLAALRWLALGVFALGCAAGARRWREVFCDPGTRRLSLFYAPAWLVLGAGMAAALAHWLGG